MNARLIVALTALCSSAAWAQVPARLGYQGRLLSADGTPVSGMKSMRFSLFDSATGGTPVWQETQLLGLSDGYYSTQLGDASDAGVPLSALDGHERFLELTIDGTALGPRQRVSSVAYAMKCDTATNLNGGVVNASSVQVNGNTVIDSSGHLTANVVINGGQSGPVTVGTTEATGVSFNTGGVTRVSIDPSGNVGVGTTTPVVRLDVAGEVRVGNLMTPCSAATEGAIRYEATLKRMEFCNGTAWGPFAAGTIASIAIGAPTPTLVKNGSVSFPVTYGTGTDSITISLAPSNITFTSPGVTGCTAAVSGTGNTRTVTVSGCMGTGSVQLSLAANTAQSTTGNAAPAAGPSAAFQVDHTGPNGVTGMVLGAVPNTLTSTPTLTYTAATDVGGSTVAGYEVQVVKDSDGSVALAYTSHTSGNAITSGLTLVHNSAYHFSVRATDALGNVGTAVDSPSWTTVNAVTIVISTDTNKFNLNTAAMAAGWTAGRPIIVTINSGVFVYSDAVATPAFSWGGLANTVQVTINNNGFIYGARVPGKVDKTTNQAWEGGAALQVGSPTTLNNVGAIVGGSGSGGPGEGDSCGGCGGGNGGTSGGQGGPAIVFNAAATITNTGTIWGAGGGGAGGGGGYATGQGSGAGGHGAGTYLKTLNAFENGSGGVSNGGAGGDYGLAGSAGGNAGNGAGAGGPGGYAMVLNAQTVTLNGSAVVANASYTPGTWLAGTKGRIAP